MHAWFSCAVRVSCAPLVFSVGSLFLVIFFFKLWWQLSIFIFPTASVFSVGWSWYFFPSFLSLFHNCPRPGVWVGRPFLPGLVAEGKGRELGPCPAQMPLWLISPLKIKRWGPWGESLLDAEALALIACTLNIKIYYKYIKRWKIQVFCYY